MRHCNFVNHKKLLLFIVLLSSISCCFADYDESIDGDLSNISTSPTAITIVDGTNTIRGSAIAAGNGERDFSQFQ